MSVIDNKWIYKDKPAKEKKIAPKQSTHNTVVYNCNMHKTLTGVRK
jgi:hypothetical protein